MKKDEILEKLLEEQQKVIENLQQTVNRYKTASDLDEDDTSDPDDFSRQTEAKDMQLRYEKHLAKALQDLYFLSEEKSKIHTVIERGSLIETDKNYIFIGISLPVLDVNSKPLVSFSEDAPVFEKIKSIKTGDKIEIGGHHYILENIF